MHAPPPVRVTVAPDRAWIGVCAVLASIASGNLAAWFAPAWMFVAPAALAGAVVAAWLARRRGPRGALAWDGQVWQWEPAGREPVAGEATVSIDLDRWMLLAFTPEQGERRWLALSRRSHAGAWSPLRAALFGARPAPLPTA